MFHDNKLKFKKENVENHLILTKWMKENVEEKQ